MAVYRPTYKDKQTGETKESSKWWFEFTFAGRHVRESSKSTRKTIAVEAEKRRRLELERALAGIPTEKPTDRIRDVKTALKAYADSYRVNHRPGSVTLVEERSKHLVRLLGSMLMPDLTETCMTNYMRVRLKEKAGNRTVNMELEIMARAVGHPWRVVWPKVKRLEEPKDTGKAMTRDEQAAILAAAQGARSPYIYPFLKIAFETGMRCDEIRLLQWSQVELGSGPDTSQITVGKAKTVAGTGRVIPMTSSLWLAMNQYAVWLSKKLEAPLLPRWHVFPFSSRVKPVDPERAITTIKSAWLEVRKAVGVHYRLHDTRHSFVSRLAEADVSEITMKQLAGHVGRAMLERYSHIRMETKRAALEKALRNVESGAAEIAQANAALQESLQVKAKATIH